MNMDDRTLLEKAARAAGYNPIRWTAGSKWPAGLLLEGVQQPWNPLTDDGDALRLANKLWIDVRHVHGKAHAGMQDEFWCTEPWFPNGDQDAATRRAIVRAAAAMADNQG